MQTFLTWDIFSLMLLLLSEKNQNLLDIQDNVFTNWEKHSVT